VRDCDMKGRRRQLYFTGFCVDATPPPSSVTFPPIRTVFARLAAGWNVDVSTVAHTVVTRRRDGEELRLIELVELMHSQAYSQINKKKNRVRFSC